MGLSGQQRQQLQEALLDAFPTTASLEQMLAHRLDKNLRAIAGEGSLQEIVFRLIQTANAEGWVENLVRAAAESNPGNSQLRIIAEGLFPSDDPKVSSPNIPQQQSVQPQYKTNNQPQFDVFLAHNSQDKSQVRKIAQELQHRGLKPWLDEEQIQPGRPFQDEIEKAIPLVKSAAIFLGLQGLGKWQRMELRALISECVNKNIPVIPVLLPGIDKIPDNLSFLKLFSWVNFAHQIDDENALNLLEWGITGQKPTQLSDLTEKPGRVPTSDDLSSNDPTDRTEGLGSIILPAYGITTLRKEVLEKRLAILIEQFVALNNQYNREGDSDERIRLKGKIDDLSVEMKEVETEINNLDGLQ